MSYVIEQTRSLNGCHVELHRLLDLCYPKPPQDVFYRVVEYYRDGYPAHLARWSDGRLVGFVYLAPNSKGGTLESLAVHPDYRGHGIGDALVRCLQDKTIGVISLTTRIPDFFEGLGFKPIMTLSDGSMYMIQPNNFTLSDGSSLNGGES